MLIQRSGYWGTNLGEPHSLPVKESGKCGSVTVRVSGEMPLRMMNITTPRCMSHR